MVFVGKNPNINLLNRVCSDIAFTPIYMLTDNNLCLVDIRHIDTGKYLTTDGSTASWAVLDTDSIIIGDIMDIY